MQYNEVIEELGIKDLISVSNGIDSFSPIDGSLLGKVAETDLAEIDAILKRSVKAYQAWKTVPAPRRGELVRLLGNTLREKKDLLGRLVTFENGKIYSEGLGEVQEMIDICDLAVGLSRQLHGLTIASERPGHSMRETWHSIGPTCIITAFNFPVAVWAWNAALALVCGNSVIWKPSEKTPIVALAVQKIINDIAENFSDAPKDLCQIAIGDAEIGSALVDSDLISLVSATGSTAMGRVVGQRVASRFGKSLLELGGNNAMIVAPSADLSLAATAIVFSAVGTAGQRCTTLRRLIVHAGIYDQIVPKIKSAYSSLKIGDPNLSETLVGPLIDQQSFEDMQSTLKAVEDEGGIIFGGSRVDTEFDNTYYVEPAIIEIENQSEVVRSETFAPILYVMKYSEFDEAIKLNNNVPQGLSSSVFTTDVREAELFLSNIGSDCGIANVNIGPSGAEIGGAFGGEKETGGGRESGSDAWKNYMRRQTNTVNYSLEMPLAQGVKFDLEM